MEVTLTLDGAPTAKIKNRHPRHRGRRWTTHSRTHKASQNIRRQHDAPPHSSTKTLIKKRQRARAATWKRTHTRTESSRGTCTRTDGKKRQECTVARPAQECSKAPRPRNRGKRRRGRSRHGWQKDKASTNQVTRRGRVPRHHSTPRLVHKHFFSKV